MTEWSPEVRVLLSPATTFRELVEERTGGSWTLLRRPLLLALMCGCTVSLQASGRLSARLVADGIVSFAFIPIFEAAALGIVYRRRLRRVPFAQAVDLFFAANAPWLLWLLAFDVVRSLQTPMQATAIPVAVIWTLELSLIPTAAWSVYIDLQFFREVLPQRAGSAGSNLILERVISWTCIIGYFLGIAIWAQVAAWIDL
jgi:hypothetical protein